MAPTDMSDKEVEAGLSLLGMMGNSREEPGGPAETKPLASERERAGEPDQLHASLMRAVASEAEQLEARRHAQLTHLSRALTLEELRAHFGKPIVQVAKELGICTTFLKKICRRCGIKRWPHRQIRSLARTIHMLRQLEAQAQAPQERAKYAAQIAQIEAKQRAVFENPDEGGKIKRVKKLSLSPSSKSGLNSSPVAAGGAPGSQGECRQEGGGSIQSSSECAALFAAATVISTSAAHLADSGSREPLADVALSPPVLGVVIPAPTGADTSQLATPVHAAAGPPSGSSPSPVVRISPMSRKLAFPGKGSVDAEQRLRSASIGSLQGEREHEGEREDEEQQRFVEA